MVSMKANTTDTANRNPNVPSRTRLSIWPWISGPWSVTTMTSTSSGMPSRLARTSLTAVVTSTVLASGSLDTLTDQARFAVGAGDAGGPTRAKCNVRHVREPH